jgi:hypothetical protein
MISMACPEKLQTVKMTTKMAYVLRSVPLAVGGVLNPTVHGRLLLVIRSPVDNPQVAAILEEHDAREGDAQYKERPIAYGLEVVLVRAPLHRSFLTMLHC